MRRGCSVSRLREGRKSAFRLHASFLPCAVDALHKLPEKTLWYLFVKKLLTGHKAAVLYQRALSMREEQLGKEHIDIAENLLNLAEIYAYKGEYEKAHVLYKRATSIYEQNLGKDHFKVAISITTQALLRQA